MHDAAVTKLRPLLDMATILITKEIHYPIIELWLSGGFLCRHKSNDRLLPATADFYASSLRHSGGRRRPEYPSIRLMNRFARY